MSILVTCKQENNIPHIHNHIDGLCLPSVTEIIHSQPMPWLDKWKAKVGVERAERKLKLSNMIGTEFHRCVEEITKGIVPVPRCPRVVGMLKTFNKWFDSVQVAPYETELKVYSKKYRYQGTLDMIGEIDGVLFLVDYKSSSGISSSMGLQLAAYAEAYKEMTSKQIDLGKIVLVKKEKPSFPLVIKDYSLEKSLFDKFLRLREEFVDGPCPFAEKQ